jgi:uroporphyrinogen decarboxylase
MAKYGDFCARMLEMALQDVQPEFIYLSEPISDNNGPLISPAMYEEFTVPAIDAIIAAAKAHECRSILVSTYGNTARLFPAMIQAGVTMLWISEAPETPELEYRFLRHKFGPSLGLIGGIPLSVVRSAASAETEQRLQEIVVPLLQSGRYVPLAGGRVRKDVCWESYRRYRELLQACLAVHQV